MRHRLSGAPWWVLSLLAGTLFGVGMFVFGLAQGASTTLAVVTAAVAGVFFGLVMGPAIERVNARARAALGEVTPAQRRTARRAALRGAVPADPDVRRAALDLLEHHVVAYRKLRWAIYLYSWLLVLALWLMLTESYWFALELPVFASLLAAQLWMPGHLRRRRALLLATKPFPAL